MNTTLNEMIKKYQDKYDFTVIPKILKNYGYNVQSRYVYQVLNQDKK